MLWIFFNRLQITIIVVDFKKDIIVIFLIGKKQKKCFNFKKILIRNVIACNLLINSITAFPKFYLKYCRLKSSIVTHYY